MKKRPFTLALVAAALAAAATVATPTREARAYPEPAIVSPSWNLEFTHGQPRAISVRGIDGQPRWYWYLPYKVVNNTGEDRLFVPEFTIYGDNGQIIQAGQDVPASVYVAIRDQLKNDLLESPVAVVGELLQGEDYAKESVAIWPDFSEDVDEFTIFVGGLSGETQTIENPATGEKTLVRRTLALHYKAPGNFPSPRNATIIAAGEEHVMR